jgi:hypothetical protein
MKVWLEEAYKLGEVIPRYAELIRTSYWKINKDWIN